MEAVKVTDFSNDSRMEICIQFYWMEVENMKIMCINFTNITFSQPLRIHNGILSGFHTVSFYGILSYDMTSFPLAIMPR